VEELLQGGYSQADKELRNEFFLVAQMAAVEETTRLNLMETGFLKLAVAVSTSPELPVEHTILKPFTQTKDKGAVPSHTHTRAPSLLRTGVVIGKLFLILIDVGGQPFLFAALPFVCLLVLFLFAAQGRGGTIPPAAQHGVFRHRPPYRLGHFLLHSTALHWQTSVCLVVERGLRMQVLYWQTQVCLVVDRGLRVQVLYWKTSVCLVVIRGLRVQVPGVGGSEGDVQLAGVLG
jgi:hypothetical protein